MLGKSISTFPKCQHLPLLRLPKDLRCHSAPPHITLISHLSPLHQAHLSILHHPQAHYSSFCLFDIVASIMTIISVWERKKEKKHRATQPCSHAATQPYSHTATQPHSHTDTQPHRQAVNFVESPTPLMVVPLLARSAPSPLLARTIAG